MSDTTTGQSAPPYVDDGSAEFVYFDLAPAFGVLSGSIQIELASRILIPTPDGGVEAKFIATGRLRCSPMAASILRDVLNSALQQLEDLQKQQTMAANKMH